jgi:hypothetical protein
MFLMAFPCHFCSGILMRPFVTSYMFGVLSSLFPEVLRYLYLSGPFVAPLYFEAFVPFPMAPSFFPVNIIFLFPLKVVSAPPGTKAASLDIVKAYRYSRITPDHRRYISLSQKGAI